MRLLFIVCVWLFACPIEAGVHWAYAPLQPQVVPAGFGTNQIDAFVRERLAREKIEASPAAKPGDLFRRVSLDLIGLAPTASEMAEFLRDPSPKAYAEQVDRLLASPRYGERWARHWLDTVHFAETHGHDQDRIRTNAWPYRDYVIRSLNEDKPYGRFVEEQVAGDILSPESPDGTIALGFLAAGPWDESSLRDIREETLDRQIARYLDRDDMITTVMQTFNSTTVQCARCHDHKFDPIPASEYYSLQAVFAAVDRANRTYDADAKVQARRMELLGERQRLRERDVDWILAEAQAARVEKQEKNSTPVKWSPIALEGWTSAHGSMLVVTNENEIASRGPRPERDVYILTFTAASARLRAVRLELLAAEDLPSGGPGRQENGNLHLNEFELAVLLPGAAAETKLKITKAVADFNQEGWTVEQAIDGNEKSAWGIYPAVGKSHQAVLVLQEPMELPRGTRLIAKLKQTHGDGHLIGRFRLSATDEEGAERSLAPVEVQNALVKRTDERTREERLIVANHFLGAEIESELKRLPPPKLVYAAATNFEPDGGLKPAGKPRAVHLLRRGEITRVGEAAVPGALSLMVNHRASFGLESSAGDAARREKLARWLSSPENVLTWRSIVNRVWHYHFGRGLVETLNDFGKMGSAPSHPELLDWLAVWFRDEAKGSLKELHRLIVLSETYQQRSRGSSTLDPENRWWWRMERGRLDAEQVRDTILQVAGKLDLRMGGPSDMQFELKPGHHVTPLVDYTKFDPASEQGTRRSIYRFLFRTLPDPFMDALDCPAGDQLTPVRTTSATVQQALALWNSALVAHYANVAGARFAQGTAEEQVERAFREILLRVPTPEEARLGVEHVVAHGLGSLCRVLLNANEFIFVN